MSSKLVVAWRRVIRSWYAATATPIAVAMLESAERTSSGDMYSWGRDGVCDA